MKEWIVAISMLVGASFSLIAALGVARMPDLFTRMQTSTKSATLGVACILLATAIDFSYDIGIVIRSVLVILFVFATAPIAAHMIGRAAYSRKVPLWEGSVIDELEGNYDPKTHTSRPPDQLQHTIDLDQRETQPAE